MAIPTTFDSFPRFSVDEGLAKRLAELGMEENLHQLRDEGYTIVRDATTPEFAAEVGAVVKELAQETEGRAHGMAAPLLLGRHPIFDELLLNPKLLALIEMTVGKGALLSHFNGSVRPQTKSGYRVGLHADQSWIPVPYPEHMQVITACFACTDFSEDGGCTMVVPKSHFERRPPVPGEMDALAGSIPLECPAGSIPVWSGETWHGSYPRREPGNRIAVHISMSRNFLRPVESYDHLPDSYFDGKPEALRIMTGRCDFFGSSTIARGGPDTDLIKDTVLRSNPEHPSYTRTDGKYTALSPGQAKREAAAKNAG